eukprot:GEZU01023014.1.p1 GENE.GEZU01023014.1~~GEZU01023014.1.p1  ORF type:complete len:377 (-),score=109.10 GEZU01023014.1:535-1503(-)
MAMDLGDAHSTILSEKEAKIYDRQIRLWGVDAQKRMTNSKLLIVGMSGIAAEISKNLVLAGVGEVVILDHVNVEAAHLAANFLVSEEQIGQNRASACIASLQELNPLVKVSHDTQPISEKQDAFFERFHLVCLTNCSLAEQVRVNNICRSKGILFFSTDTFGMDAIMFADLLEFKYTIKEKEKREDKLAVYTSLEHVLTKAQWKNTKFLSKHFLGLQLLQFYKDKYGQLPVASDFEKLQALKQDYYNARHLEASSADAQLTDDYIRNLARTAQVEYSPVCAIMGGMVAQEIIKVISRNADPINNFFVFDGAESSAGYIEFVQ